MKKYLMVAVALICMTMTSIVFTSCEKEETTIKRTTVYYSLNWKELEYAKGQENTVKAFLVEVNAVLESIQDTETDEAVLIGHIQDVVEKYDHQYIRGNLYLLRSFDNKNFIAIMTYTMKLAGEGEEEEEF